MTRLEGVDADRIYEYDIFPTRRLRDEEFGNESLEIALNLPRDGQVTLKLPNNVLTDQRRFVSALADKGAFVRPREIAPLQTYLIEYAKLLQREEPAQEEFSRFGWRDLETNTPRFVMGDYVISHNGDLRKSTPAPYLAPLKDVISTKGDFDKWKAAFDVYKDISCHAFRFTQMLGFAAPLFALTPFHGLLFNLVGASGTGKSTALKMMASIWGKPNERHILVQDNKIPIFNTIGSLQNIPITCDELTLIGSDTLADIAYAITEGRGKNRADEKGRTRLNQIQWKTLVCGASNMSLYEKLGMARSGNNAHAYRIFEVQASRARTADQIKIDSAIREVEIHYGFAGRLFIAYVIKNIDTVRDLIEQMWGHYAKHYKMATAERFWYMLFACVAVGGSIAKKLGIHDYDVDGIVAWGIDQLSGVRQLVNAVEGDPLSLLSHFMQTNINSTVHIINNQPQNYNNSELNIRMEWLNDSPMRAYLSIPSVKKFCAENNIDYAWFSRKLKEQKIALDTNITKNLGKDTDLVTGLIKAWEIDVTKFPDRDTLIHKPKENSSLH